MVIKFKYETINIAAFILMISFFFLPVTAPYFKLITFYPIFAVWFLTALRIDHALLRKSRHHLFFLACILLWALLFWVLKGSNSHVIKFITFTFITYCGGFAFWFYIEKTELFQKSVKFLVVMLIIGIITTFRGLSINPMASRILATGDGKYPKSLVDSFKNMGIGGYDFIYSLVFLLPVLLYLAKKVHRRINRIIILSACVMSVLCIIRSGYSMSIIFSFFLAGITLTELFSPQKYKKLVFFIVIIVVLIMVFRLNSIINMIARIGDFFGSYYVSTRMQELSNAIMDENLTYLERIRLYQNGFHNFLMSPFLGKMITSAGETLSSGHSEIINYLEQYGIIGIGYLVYLISFVKKVRSYINSSEGRFICMISQIAVIIFAFLNTLNSASGVCCCFFCIIPMIIMMYENKQEEVVS